MGNTFGFWYACSKRETGMPWKVCCTMALKEEFVIMAKHEDANIAALCRRFSISRKTGYKWIKRFANGDRSQLADRSRRPRHSPRRSSEKIEQVVVQVREQHPAWGGRKLRTLLVDQGHN